MEKYIAKCVKDTQGFCNFGDTFSADSFQECYSAILSDYKARHNAEEIYNNIDTVTWDIYERIDGGLRFICGLVYNAQILLYRRYDSIKLFRAAETAVKYDGLKHLYIAKEYDGIPVEKLYKYYGFSV